MLRNRIIKTCARSSFAKTLFSLLFSYGFQAIAVYRFGRWIDTKFQAYTVLPAKLALNLFYIVAAWMIRAAYGIDISREANIGPGLYIGHFGGIHVGPCTMGPNCSIHSHVKITSNKIDGSVPKIGTNVWIGGHARIEGVAIGDCSTIAAGAYVRNDVKAGSLVAGIPARLVLSNYNNDEILNAIEQ